MESNKIFRATLVISVIAHTVVLLQNPNLNLFPEGKKNEKIEVSYVKVQEKQKTILRDNSVHQKNIDLNHAGKITLKNVIPPVTAEKENIFNKNRDLFTRSASNLVKPTTIKPDVIAVKKKITLPPVDIDKIDNPSYINYYQFIREKIRRSAYQNYVRTETGEIYLSFIVYANGQIKETRLLEDKSSADSYLREIALQSVKDASPFPYFPKELDYPQLSFNVIISFEVD
jgi:TonB family protein